MESFEIYSLHGIRVFFAILIIVFCINLFGSNISTRCCAEDIEELCTELQNELINISEWMRQKKMSLIQKI